MPGGIDRRDPPVQPPAGTLKRIVYVSQALKPYPALPDDAFIGEILAVSRRNNARRGITGALLYGEGQFGQVLEGPEGPVEEAFGIIAGDPRHAALRILARTSPACRAFEAWNMAYVEDLDLIPPEFSHAGEALSLLTRLREVLGGRVEAA
jgi:hypothetical protein